MYVVHLEKIESTHNNLRTKTVDGYCVNLPSVGEPFVMYGEPLENPSASCRLVWTSPVKNIKEVIKGNDFGHLVIHTENSVYEIHYGKKVDDNLTPLDF